ncbi:MAG: murein biosynthesis integral membrane protein MurJ [Gallionellales bacterium 35-53-114]|jgi:putative peptidoglycan lipid II flippase|nr:MAG: murein biosynthesis integral membrane protein MurJ [Gallionellales bacterium 35-53-114]OYZ65432.1 MAG: murein biosynthesis integral membrane protein MurJ [Gallionellales bacterium 24-53-125]OZB08338.1 MAG: murein biosynthesis integral membrane protein MurJ [Gallionellales bacterium 39-52-133]HQS58279.1 murein biosynthesis integral membrane protein MurJ [Gallionellaceae bacterium]HQS73834.1 murein biosynthesis integral membrane protein MurJ [Gallionellaceae bacterium]
MNLLKTLASISSMTLLSRILGFVRDMMMARIFGAGMANEAFVIAYRLPNLLRRMFAEGAFSQAFVPIFSEYKSRRGHEETKLLVDHVTTLLAIILFVITLVGIVAAPVLVFVTAPGFVANQEKFNLTVELLRITSPYIFFISLVSVAAGILNTYNKYWVSAFAPVLLNLCFIGAMLWLVPYFKQPIMALAWAVFLGGFIQLAFQIPFLKKIGMLPRWRFSLKDEGVWRVLKQMGPAIFGVSISQISLVINTIFASFMVLGSVSWLFYADRLMEIPAGLLGVAISTILLTSLSKYHAESNAEEYSRILDWGLRLTMMLTLPAALSLGLIAVPLLSTFFQGGAFLAHDVLMTRNALVGYSIGLIGMLLVKVLAPAFYARQDIRTPVKVGIITLVATQMMNLIFISWLKYEGQPQHAGLALAIGLGACINSGILYYLLRKRGIFQPEPGWLKFSIKLLIALLALGLVLWFGMGAEQQWLTTGGWPRVLHLSGLVVAGMVVYFAVLAVLGFRLGDFSRRSAD